MAERSSDTVQSVARAFAILEAMSETGGEAGVSELAARLGVTMPTVHRLVRSLVGLGYVRQLPSRRYALGPGLVRLGEQASAMIGTWARPAMEALEHEVQESVNLAALDGDMAVYVAQVPSRRQMRMFTEVGRRVHLHSTGVGKALLAQLPDAQVEAIVERTGLPRYTATTITEVSALLSELGDIRSRGYAIDEGEQETGVRCFAVAVPGAPSPVALSVSGPDARVTLDSATWLVSALERAAQRVVRELAVEPSAD